MNTVRRLLSAPLAVLIALGLFWFMQYLITLKGSGTGPGPAVDIDDVVQLAPPKPPAPPSQAQALSAPPPPAPSAPDIPDVPVLAIPTIKTPSLAQVEVDVPDISVSVNIGSALKVGSTLVSVGAGLGGGGSGGSGGGGGGNFSGSELKPASSSRPIYPDFAFENKIEGWVVVGFYINPQGQVEKPWIIDAEPKGVFEEEAAKAVLRWQYDFSRGYRKAKQRFDFKLEDYGWNWRDGVQQ